MSASSLVPEHAGAVAPAPRPTPRSRLLVAQALSSLSNGVVIFVAAIVLPTEDFNRYALIQLVAVTAIAFQRAALIEPALALRDNGAGGAGGGLRVVWGVGSSAVLGVLVTAALVPLVDPSPSEAAVIVVGAWIVLAQDYFRYLWISTDGIVRVWVADSTWLVVALSLMVVLPHTTLGASVALFSGAAVSLVVCVAGAWAWSSTTPLPNVLKLGRYQAFEYLVSQLTFTVPLLVVGAIYPAGPIGALRLAQTAMGPIAIWFGAAATHLLLQSSDLLADTVTHVRRRALVLGRHLVVGTLVYVAVLAAAVAFAVDVLGIHLPDGVLAAVVLVGAVTVLTAWTGAFVAVLRAVRAQEVAARVRLVCALVATVVLVAVLPAGRPWLIGVLPIAAASLTGLVLWPRAFERVAAERLVDAA